MVDIGHRPGRRSLGPRAASGDFLPYFVHFSGRRFGGKNPPAILSEVLTRGIRRYELDEFGRAHRGSKDGGEVACNFACWMEPVQWM
jgi:hypothetical protein